MTTLQVFSKAKEFFSALGGAADRVIPQSMSLAAAKELQQSLELHLAEHLSAYADVQAMLKLGTPFNELRECGALIRDAKSLASEIASIPGYKFVEPLRGAYDVLAGHWRNSWSNGGVSPAQYRARLKGAILFLRSHSVRVACV
ncbi:MAG TPA: hypothetical protein VKX17_00720 [Planctomycetota bacterium]|nr:hypothetical protein [Planctomycetota bacterium]